MLWSVNGVWLHAFRRGAPEARGLVRGVLLGGGCSPAAVPWRFASPPPDVQSASGHGCSARVQSRGHRRHAVGGSNGRREYALRRGPVPLQAHLCLQGAHRYSGDEQAAGTDGGAADARTALMVGAGRGARADRGPLSAQRLRWEEPQGPSIFVVGRGPAGNPAGPWSMFAGGPRAAGRAAAAGLIRPVSQAVWAVALAAHKLDQAWQQGRDRRTRATSFHTNG